MPPERDDAPTELQGGALPAPSLATGQIVADRYRIVAELGRGGMGHVFRAEDTRLGQPVALKFLGALTGSDAGLLDRLAAEVRIGRGVSHPNVCRIYDIADTADGLHFIAMEFVDGEDLASLLRRIGRFAADRGAGVARDICAGLAAAHDQGVVHRDLKPANIMIDGRGRARITDFGLAVGQGEAHGRELAGTPAYMSPEQLRGEPADARSDLYALGLVLFEMFTGRRLYDGRSAGEVARLHRTPVPAPSSIVADLPAGIDRAVLACLEETPARRPASAREVAAMLPASDGAVHTPGRASDQATPRSGERGERSIAVLPFEDLSGTGDEAFSAGLADEIISDLAAIKALRVIARGSVMRYRGSVDVAVVGRELQVAYVLGGSVRRSGDRLRLHANLVDVASGEVVWAEKFNGSLSDIFDIQETVARAVTTGLRAHVTTEESARIAERPIADPVAYEHYVRARSLIWTFRPEALASAGELLRRAEAVTGENVAILDAMAFLEWQYFNTRVDPAERRLARAEALASRIVELDPQAAAASRIRALIALTRGDPRTGARLLRDVVDRDPADSEATMTLLLAYIGAGRFDLGAPLADRLLTRDPLGFSSLTARAHFAAFSGDLENALQIAASAAGIQPGSSLEYLRGSVLAQQGRRDEAARVWDEYVAGTGDNIFKALATFMAAVVRNDRARAMAVYGQWLERPARASLIFGAEIAMGFGMLGDTERCVDWLTNAVSRGFYAHEWVRRAPVIASVLADPRIQALLETMQRESATFP